MVGDDPFFALLTRRGFTPAAALATASVTSQIRTMSGQAGVEYAAMLDANSGALVGAIRRGDARRVSIEAHLRALEPGHAYVQIHTHLTSPTWSFSLDDGVLFAAYPAIRAMVVVGVNGTRYLLSRHSASRGVDAALMDRIWRREAARHVPAFRERIAAGLSTVEAERALRHEIWRTVAARFRLRYDRMESRGETWLR
jgi:hypothetical protein